MKFWWVYEDFWHEIMYRYEDCLGFIIENYFYFKIGDFDTY